MRANPVRALRWYDRLVLLLGHVAGWLSRRAGRGAGRTLPGRVVLMLRPRILRSLSSGRLVVLVSGTNGKTTTTRLLRAALGTQGPTVSNDDGANLLPGLVAALLAARTAHDAADATAVLEVDELVLPRAIVDTSPAVVVLLNLSRDQLDRVEEVSSHVRRWSAALAGNRDVRVVANADDPLVVAAVRTARPDDRNVDWVAAGAPWRSDAPLCPQCASAWSLTDQPWCCDRCGFTAPVASWQVTDGLEVRAPDGQRIPTALALPGRANAANAAVAVAAAVALDVPAEVALRACRTVHDVDGRYLTVMQAGRPVQLLLAKNPAGWMELLGDVAPEPTALLLGINARAADGRDPSWLWDVPFEQLRGRTVAVFGDRALDLSVRLQYGEVPHVVAADLASALAALPDVPVQVAASYTAFVGARAALRGAA